MKNLKTNGINREIVILLLFSTVMNIAGYSSAAPAKQLKIQTMGELFQQLRERHPVFKLGADQVQIEIQQRNSYLGAEDWVLSADSSISHFQTIQESESPNDIEQLSAGLGLSRHIWEAGGRVSMQWGFRRNHLNYPAWQNRLFQVDMDSYENVLSLNYIHPLLKNSHGMLDRTNYDASNYIVQAAAVNAREQEEYFLLTAGLEFIDWVLLEEQIKILHQRIKLSNEQISQVKKKLITNLVNKVDVLRAEDSQRNTSQSLVLVEAHRDSKRNKLAELLRGAGLASVPQFALYQKQDLPPISVSNRYISEHSRATAHFSLQLSELSRRKESAAEETNAELSLIFGVAIKGGGIEARDTFDPSKQDASIGLHFSQPLGNRSAKSRLNKITLQIHALKLQRSRALIDLRSQVAALSSQLMRMGELLDLNQQHIQSAIMTTAEELRLYNQGRNDLATVILSQDREQLARLSYANNAASYQRSLLQLEALLDKLVPNSVAKPQTAISLFTGEK